MQTGVVAPNPGPDARAEMAGPLLHLLLELAHELTRQLHIRERLGGPEDGPRAGAGREEQGSAPDLDGVGHLREGLPAALAVAAAHDQPAYERDVAARDQRSADRQCLALQLQLGVEVVADQGMKEPREGACAA